MIWVFWGLLFLKDGLVSFVIVLWFGDWEKMEVGMGEEMQKQGIVAEATEKDTFHIS